MNWATLGAFLLFVIIMTGTPGPGNLTFMAVGASAGYRRTLPLILASQIGSIALMFSVVFGLGTLVSSSVALETIMKVVSLGYMTFLAYKISRLEIHDQNLDGKLPSLGQMILIHPLSPKTWAMGLTGYTSFFVGNGQPPLTNAAMLAAGFVAGGLVFHSLWALTGAAILSLIANRTMAKAVVTGLCLSMLGVTIWALFS